MVDLDLDLYAESFAWNEMTVVGSTCTAHCDMYVVGWILAPLNVPV